MKESPKLALCHRAHAKKHNNPPVVGGSLLIRLVAYLYILFFMSNENNIKRITLLSSLEHGWFKLPTAVMKDVGAATQTFAALAKISTKTTFVREKKIAEQASLPLATVRKHLCKLQEAGWISNSGRQRTDTGVLRRTATRKINPNALHKSVMEPYGVLPWWASANYRNTPKMPWCAKAVFSIVMSQLMTLKAVAEQNQVIDHEEIMCYIIDELGGDDRFAFSLKRLSVDTGLSPKSITKAKRWLCEHGLVYWQENKRADGGDDKDFLVPNWPFNVIVTPASEGMCYLDLDSVGEETGVGNLVSSV